MKLYRWSEVAKEQMSPAIARQVIHTERMTVARVHLAKGGIVAGHRHANEQCTLLEKGRLRFTVEGESVELEAGCVLQVPANAFHQVEALEDSVAVDVFTPRREDWLRGEDAYLRS
ncbi:MAG: cupin domain-containing protein [Bryobacterales bacterium]|nr:cupin domain-containing protein [Bryobacteraceae bacterium]MDW8131021.1 cupin domain-containing protein [Bryobacterales bacterium]